MVELANEMKMQAPVNALLTRLVKEAQTAAAGSPRVPIKQLFTQVEQAAPESISSGAGKCMLL